METEKSTEVREDGWKKELREKAEGLGVLDVINQAPIGGTVDLPELLHYYYERNYIIKNVCGFRGTTQDILIISVRYRNETENPFSFDIIHQVKRYPNKTPELARAWYIDHCQGKGRVHSSWKRSEPDYAGLVPLEKYLEYFHTEVRIYGTYLMTTFV